MASPASSAGPGAPAGPRSPASPCVLLVHYTFPGAPGGVELVVGQHARALRDAGARVVLVAGRGSPGVSGVECTRIREVDSRHVPIAQITRALADGRVPAAFEELRATLRDRLAPLLGSADRVVLHNVATLHLNLPLVAALHDLAPGLPEGRLIVWVHDLALANPRYAAFRHLGRPWDLMTRPLPHARYVTISEQRRAETAAVLGLPEDAIEVVPNGVDLAAMERLSTAAQRLLAASGAVGGVTAAAGTGGDVTGHSAVAGGDVTGLSAVAGGAVGALIGGRSADPLLVLPARLTRRKRIEIAIGAAVELRRRGRRALLLVAGAPDPHSADGRAYHEELRALVADSGGAAVLLYDLTGSHTPHHRLAELYSAADALVFPSESEGFGIPVIEAAVLRLPVICTDIPVLREILADGATFVGASAGPREWADAIESTLDGDRASRLARRVRTEYDLAGVLANRVVPLILG